MKHKKPETKERVSTHLPPQYEHGDQINEEDIVALREKTDDDAFLPERAGLQASYFNQVVDACPDVGEELSPSNGRRCSFLFGGTILQEAYDLAIGVGACHAKEVFRDGYHGWERRRREGGRHSGNGAVPGQSGLSFAKLVAHLLNRHICSRYGSGAAQGGGHA